ncbi:hypothetical protein TRE132_05550 [Pseudomonas chlororaphis subsp. aurantiaca]|nr:hypothetical protein TRE132_05550 [Pseudomonas chlororaphis subsp. aurantiaca]
MGHLAAVGGLPVADLEPVRQGRPCRALGPGRRRLHAARRRFRYRDRHAVVVVAADRRLLKVRQACAQCVWRYGAGVLYRQPVADEPGRGLHLGLCAEWRGQCAAAGFGRCGPGDSAVADPAGRVGKRLCRYPFGRGFQRHSAAPEGRAPGFGHWCALHPDRLPGAVGPVSEFPAVDRLGVRAAVRRGAGGSLHPAQAQCPGIVGRFALAGVAGLAGWGQHLPSAGQPLSGHWRNPAVTGAGRAAARAAGRAFSYGQETARA